MKKLTVLRERAEKLKVRIGECKDIADDLDDALKSANKVLTPQEIKDTAERISHSVESSAAHPRARG